MSKLRSISTLFWSDPYIEELTASEKLLFLYLITNEKTNMLGIYEASVSKISFETSIPKETVRKGLERFESDKKVRYIGNYVLVINYMKHQNYNPNMMKSAIDVYNNLPEELKIKGVTISKDNPLKGFETLRNHYGMVRKYEVEYEIEVEVESEIESEFEIGDHFLSEIDLEKVEGLSEFDMRCLRVAKSFHTLIHNQLKTSGSPTAKHEKSKVRRWTDPIRLMYSEDGFKDEHFKALWNSLKTSTFWSGKILSGKSLREQALKIISDKNGKQKNYDPAYLQSILDDIAGVSQS